MKWSSSTLPKADLEHIPVEKAARVNPKRNGAITLFDAWQTLPSPLNGNGMKLKVITGREHVPVALVAEFNLPNATVGQNAELGHSVFAANTVAVDFLKIFLAKQRVPRDSLDMLTVENMKAGSVTITHLIHASKVRPGQSIIDSMLHRFEQFFSFERRPALWRQPCRFKGQLNGICQATRLEHSRVFAARS